MAPTTPDSAPRRPAFTIAPKTDVLAERVFRCSRDENVAGTVRLHANPGGREGLTMFIASFVGEHVYRITPERVAQATELVARGDAAGLFRMDHAYVPFYCPKCEAIYCAAHWHQRDVYADDYPGWFEESRGTCPNGHERRLSD